MNMGIDVTGIIAGLQRQKRESGIKPEAVGKYELLHAVNDCLRGELNRLYKEGRIDYHRTINGYTVEIKGTGDENDSADNG